MSNVRRRSIMLGAALAVAATALAQVGPLTSQAVAPQSTGTWSRLAVPALNGQAVSVAYDAVRGRLVAEVSNGGRLSTAALSGATWQLSGPPSLLGPSSLVYDAALGTVVAMTGLCARTWSGTAWSPPSCLPAGLGSAVRAAAYDGNRGVLLAVIDTTESNCCISAYNDTETWTWDGTTWRKLSPRHEPTPVTLLEPGVGCPLIPDCVTVVPETVFPETGSAIWNPALHQVVLVGDGNRTFTWDGFDWAGGVVPALAAEGPPSLTYDSAAGTVFSFSSPQLTAVRSGLVWKPLVTTGLAPLGGPVAEDPQLGGVVLLGETAGAAASTLWRFTPGISA
jgi:hypothetical protein